jgi:hypothetical protein
MYSKKLNHCDNHYSQLTLFEMNKIRGGGDPPPPPPPPPPVGGDDGKDDDP